MYRRFHYFSLTIVALLCGCMETEVAYNPDQNQGQCENDDVSCFENAVHYCYDGAWLIYKKCPYGCNPSSTACADKSSPSNDTPSDDTPSVCTDGDVSCTGSSLRKCQNNTWIDTTCDLGCNDLGTACKTDDDDPVITCDDGAVLCENDTKKVCSDNAWNDTKCEYGCHDNGVDCADPPVCLDGTILCSESMIKRCENNHWTDGAKCEYGCNADGSECAKCAEGSVTCTDNTLSTCKNDTLSTSNCEFGCNAGKNACAKCKEGSVTCTGNTLTACKNDSLSKTTCEFGCNAAANACDTLNQNQPTRYLMKTLHSPITPYVVQQMKNIAAKSSSKSSNVFIKVGDSHYDYDFDGCFMKCFSTNNSNAVSLDTHTYLTEVIAQFQKTKDSFMRDSLAAIGGKSTRDVTNNTPSYITQEISKMNPRFMFFGHGSNDIGNSGFTYATNGAYKGYKDSLQNYYRQVNKALDQATSEGVIPLMSGITPVLITYSNVSLLSGAPAIDHRDQPRYIVPAFNAVSRGIAEARQIPWFDTFNAFYPLKNQGLRSDNIHGSYSGSPCNFTASGLQYGVNQRNLGSIQMLDEAWRTVVKGEKPKDEIEEPFRGSGTKNDPYVITSLPYTHSANTATGGTSSINVYSGCSDDAEYGPEFYYKMVLSKKTRLKIFVVSDYNVDVDLHVMKNSISPSACFVRSDVLTQGYLNAGTYYLSADTYGKSGSTSPGRYLLAVVECMDDDPRCDVALHN